MQIPRVNLPRYIFRNSRVFLQKYMYFHRVFLPKYIFLNSRVFLQKYISRKGRLELPKSLHEEIASSCDFGSFCRHHSHPITRPALLLWWWWWWRFHLSHPITHAPLKMHPTQWSDWRLLCNFFCNIYPTFMKLSSWAIHKWDLARTGNNGIVDS